MSVVLHVSDTHFGTEVTPVIDALLDFAGELSPDVLVLSGDITQRARREEFEAARRFVAKLAVPRLLALPGNHDLPLYDLPTRLLAPYRNYRRAFGQELEPSLESDQLLVLGVNTTRWWRAIDGTVSAPQIARVSERLRAARREQLRVVVTHQPIWVSRARDEKDLLHGHAAALSAWAEAGADVILGGHIHLPYSAALGVVHAGLARNVWCIQAGTATSSRVRWEAPNSCNVLRTDSSVDGAPECVHERWDYDADVRRFQCVQRNLWRPERGT